MEQLFENSNDFDIVRESVFRQSSFLFKEFWPEFNTHLAGFKEKYNQTEQKANYSFHFETTSNDEEIINSIHKNIKIKMKLEGENEEEESKSEGEGKDEEIVETSNLPKTKEETGHTTQPSFKSLYRIDKCKKKMHQYDFNSKQVNSTTYNESSKEIDQEQDKKDIGNAHNELLLNDSRSWCLDWGEIYAFGASETKFSDFLWKVDWTELEECNKLPVKRKKISCVSHKNYIYFTGEFENINTNRATLERYDTEKQVYEEIYGLNKQSNYLLCIVNNRFLYAFPCSINSYKILVLDLDRLQEIKIDDKENCFKGEWLKFSPKNPNNINLYLSYKSSIIQISNNELFLSSLKYGYIYNIDTHQFTGQYNFAWDDEFYDGFLLKDRVLYGFGSKGIHKFDLLLKKWTFTKHKKDTSDDVDSDLNKSNSRRLHYERGMSDEEDSN